VYTDNSKYGQHHRTKLKCKTGNTQVSTEVSCFVNRKTSLYYCELTLTKYLILTAEFRLYFSFASRYI